MLAGLFQPGTVRACATRSPGHAGANKAIAIALQILRKPIGASKGIGAAIVIGLAAEGAFVFVNYSSSKGCADKVVSAITAAGGRVTAARGDVSRGADAQTLSTERFDLLQL